MKLKIESIDYLSVYESALTDIQEILDNCLIEYKCGYSYHAYDVDEIGDFTI